MLQPVANAIGAPDGAYDPVKDYMPDGNGVGVGNGVSVGMGVTVGTGNGADMDGVGVVAASADMPGFGDAGGLDPNIDVSLQATSVSAARPARMSFI